MDGDGSGGESRDEIMTRRAAKRRRLCSPPNSKDDESVERVAHTDEPQDDDPKPSSSCSTSASASKVSREREFWDEKSKELFFESLKVHGRDWKRMAQYIQHKSKNRYVKKHDQIKSFYYNALSKISQHLGNEKFNAVNKKEVRELYGMVNYGEWRKKTGLIEVDASSFVELLWVGQVKYTLPKTKRKKSTVTGRQVVIRTPICPAIKRLFETDDDKQKYPLELRILLRPRRVSDKSYMAGLYKNPYVRFTCKPEDSVADLIRYLEAMCKIERPAAAGSSLALRFRNGGTLKKVHLRCKEYEHTSGSYSMEELCKFKEALNKAKAGGAPFAPPEPKSVLLPDPDPASVPEGGESGSVPENTNSGGGVKSKGDSGLIILDPTRLRQGITVDSCGPLTVGELFLMAGACGEDFIDLDYEIAMPESSVVPAWKCFVELLQTEFAEKHKLRTAKDPIPAVCKPHTPQSQGQPHPVSTQPEPSHAVIGGDPLRPEAQGPLSQNGGAHNMPSMESLDGILQEGMSGNIQCTQLVNVEPAADVLGGGRLIVVAEGRSGE